MMPSPVSGTLDRSNATPYATMFSVNPGKDEDISDEGSRKKKVKTTLSMAAAFNIQFHSPKDRMAMNNTCVLHVVVLTLPSGGR